MLVERGLTLVELLVGMAIVAILLALGVPSIAEYLQSAKMNSAAQSYLTGLQLARSEAVRRNGAVSFVLTDTPIAQGIENARVPSVNGRNWLVSWFDAPNAMSVLIDAKAAVEGAASVTAPSVTIAGVGAPNAFNGIVTFNGFGATVGANAFAFTIKNLQGGTCAPAGRMRCPGIVVPAGGQVRLCDPVAAPGDSRAC